jgi:hypothetical protein
MTKLLANLPKYMALVCAAIIALLPFHAFLTVWLASGLGHYTALRLWKEALLILLFIGVSVLFFTRPKLRRACRQEPLILLAVVYVLLVIAVGAIAYFAHGVSLKAYAYGLLLDSRYLIFFGVTWAVTQFNDLLVRFWKQIVLIPAAIVSAFAAVEYALLPADFLKHFGYGPATIQPTPTIDQQAAYRRIQSTLRGPNPLGAYLVVIITALSTVLVQSKKLQWKIILLYVFSGLALVFSFSRSAWLGAIVSIIFLIWLAAASAGFRKYLLLAGAVGIVVCGLVGFSLRNNDHFQNVFFHTSEQSRSSKSSNEGHLEALKSGGHDVLHAPWGAGTGTAGPASVYNQGKARIAENYYVQIAQEAGVAGLGLFIAINVLVFLRLYNRRAHPLALTLLVSLVGITVVNMLGHAWADDTLAYIWWGLAGAATALPVKQNYDTNR